MKKWLRFLFFTLPIEMWRAQVAIISILILLMDVPKVQFRDSFCSKMGPMGKGQNQGSLLLEVTFCKRDCKGLREREARKVVWPYPLKISYSVYLRARCTIQDENHCSLANKDQDRGKDLDWTCREEGCVFYG